MLTFQLLKLQAVRIEKTMKSSQSNFVSMYGVLFMIGLQDLNVRVSGLRHWSPTQIASLEAFRVETQ
jgi:hypothetical protein